MKKTALITLALCLSMLFVGCSNKQDVGDAEKDPPKGAVKPMAPAPLDGGASQLPPTTEAKPN